jgi:ribosomal-protein-alanine N-acetyltransferase
MTVSLRPLRPGDEADLARLHAACFERAWPEKDFAAWLFAGDGFGVLGPDVGGASEREAVAFALARDTGDDAELLSVATLPSARRQGWGRAMLLGALEEARLRGHRRVVLEVSVANTSALGLYLREGFVEIGRRKGYYQEAGGGVDALVLARALIP